MHAQAARGLRDIVVAQLVDALDMLPADAISRHRVFRRRRQIAPTGQQRGSDIVGIRGFGEIVSGTRLDRSDGALALKLFKSNREAGLILVLALAGSLARQGRAPTTAGTLPTHSNLFVGLVVFTAILVTALVFFPVLSLGPLAEGLL